MGRQHVELSALVVRDLYVANFLSKLAFIKDSIAIRVTMGASVGIPVSSLCIVRRLYKIASVQAVSQTLPEVRTNHPLLYSF